MDVTEEIVRVDDDNLSLGVEPDEFYDDPDGDPNYDYEEQLRNLQLLSSPSKRDSLDEGYDPNETLKVVVYDDGKRVDILRDCDIEENSAGEDHPQEDIVQYEEEPKVRVPSRGKEDVFQMTHYDQEPKVMFYDNGDPIQQKDQFQMINYNEEPKAAMFVKDTAIQGAKSENYEPTDSDLEVFNTLMMKQGSSDSEKKQVSFDSDQEVYLELVKKQVSFENEVSGCQQENASHEPNGNLKPTKSSLKRSEAVIPHDDIPDEPIETKTLEQKNANEWIHSEKSENSDEAVFKEIAKSLDVSTDQQSILSSLDNFAYDDESFASMQTTSNPPSSLGNHEEDRTFSSDRPKTSKRWRNDFQNEESDQHLIPVHLLSENTTPDNSFSKVEEKKAKAEENTISPQDTDSSNGVPQNPCSTPAHYPDPHMLGLQLTQHMEQTSPESSKSSSENCNRLREHCSNKSGSCNCTVRTIHFTL